MTVAPSLPKTPIKGDPETRRFLEAVRQYLVSTGKDFVTREDLSTQSFIDSLGVTFPAGSPDGIDTPTIPSNLTTDGVFENIILEWAYTAYRGHAYTRVYRNTVNNFSTASVLVNISGKVYADPVSPGVGFYYWVANVNVAGIESAPNQVAGTLGQTSLKPEYLTNLLQGQITESQLYAALASRISLIDAASSVAGSVNARLQSEASARAQAILDEASYRANGDSNLQTQINTIVAGTTGDLQDVLAAIQEEQTARTDADEAEAASRQTLATQIRGNYTGTDPAFLASGLLYSERVARVNADSAEVSAREALAVTVQNNYETLEASISEEQSVRIDADEALAQSITVLASTVANNTAAIQLEQSTRADDDEALSQSISSLTATVNGNTAAIQQESSARILADGALSGQITTLTGTVNGNTSALQQEIANRVNADNTLFAKYTVKIDQNGYVSGFGLASAANDAIPTSAFSVRSDSFYIASPSGPGIAPTMPFIVRTTAVTINGVTVPAGVYMTDAFIQNGSISNAKIGNLAVDNAKIADAAISFAKIGDLQVGTAKIAFGAIDNARLGFAAVGTANIQDAAINTAKIGDAQVDTLKIAGNAVTLPLVYTGGDVSVTETISASSGGYACGYVYNPDTGQFDYVCGPQPAYVSGGHTVLETGWIDVGGGGLICVFYGTMDATALKDAGQLIAMLVDKNDGQGYQVTRQTKAGAVTNNGNTYAALPVAVTTTVSGVNQVKIKIMTGKYLIATSATSNPSYLRDTTLSVLGAKR